MNEKNAYHEKGKDPLFKVWHASDMAMIIYMHSDGGSIVCSEKAYPIKEGTLCFIGTGKYHYTMPDSPENYERSKLFISQEKIDKITDILSEKNRLINFTDEAFIYAQIDENQRDETNKLFNEAINNDDELISLAATAKLLAYLCRYSLETAPRVSGTISKAIEYINSNIFTNIDINEICTAVHISKYHFCRQFKKHTGMTVMEYILKTRIVMAKNMLLKEKFSVTEISNRCGFSSISYFSRVFREETGVTPLSYRKTGE